MREVALAWVVLRRSAGRRRFVTRQQAGVLIQDALRHTRDLSPPAQDVRGTLLSDVMKR